jgi:hypothetical protein
MLPRHQALPDKNFVYRGTLFHALDDCDDKDVTNGRLAAAFLSSEAATILARSCCRTKQ